ncbi:MAG: hypothetical protein K0S47_4512 [Herbinix sp.]|nr:hypothetical protein [Herbinix sp.]
MNVLAIIPASDKWQTYVVLFDRACEGVQVY